MTKIATALIVLSLPALSFAAPEVYIIDGAHTMPRFEYSHLGYSTQVSRFEKTTGTITLDRAAKRGSANIVIDAKSVSTGSSAFNTHLQGDDFFATGTYPEIQYQSDTFKFEGDTLVSVEGNLTIKGITKPVTLTIRAFACKPHPMFKKEACGADATASIKRSDFNMGKYAPQVSDDVTLIIPIESMKQ